MLGRVQVNPLSTLEEEEDEYSNNITSPSTSIHPSIQALDVLQHRGGKFTPKSSKFTWKIRGNRKMYR
jgi:hypothetical protein